MQTHVVVIGAGPAGLTAGYLLAKENTQVTVLEADPQYVGGIAKTVNYKGYCFDIGGHRFFSKSDAVEQLWTEILPDDLFERPRSSRIFYKKQFFSYPLKAFEALQKLGVGESILCILSYFKAKLFPIREPVSFADWVTNKFGKRLFAIFFKTYTEKVWGMSCDSISADWAAQRIKGLSLYSAIINAAMPVSFRRGRNKKVIKTLIDKFRYPRKGPGMLWEACAEKMIQRGGRLYLGCQLYRCEYMRAEQHWLLEYTDKQEKHHQLIATHVISSIPLREMVLDYLRSHVSPPSLMAANELRYRDFLIVSLIVKERHQFDDNWIYIHDPRVKVARIQNFKSWSPEMVPDPAMCCYGMEYFCFKDDDLWSKPDDELIKYAAYELVKLGIVSHDDVVDGCVIRQAKAYPVYDNHYRQHVETIRYEIETRFPTLYLVGRNGMHKYNNQDHAMMTAMLTVRNILANKRLYDVWNVNQDAEYIESGEGDHQLEAGLRAVPKKITESID